MHKALLKLVLTSLWFYTLVLACFAASEGRWDEGTYWLIFVIGAFVGEKLSEVVFHLMAVNYHLLKLIDKEKKNDTSSS